MSTELFVFARFDARAGYEAAVAEAVERVVSATRAEPGCMQIHAYRASKPTGRMIIHSRWRDDAAFESHGRLPHTVEFLERVRALITHELDVTRAEKAG